MAQESNLSNKSNLTMIKLTDDEHSFILQLSISNNRSFKNQVETIIKDFIKSNNHTKQ